MTSSSSSCLRFVADGSDIPHLLFLLPHLLQPLAPALRTREDASLSDEEGRARRLLLCHMKHTCSEQRQLGTTIHASFNELQSVHVPFYWTITPRQCQSCKHRRFVFSDASSKRLELRQVRRLNLV